MALSKVGKNQVDQSASLTVDSDLTVDGTIKLDGNYPVGTGNVALGDAALDDGSLSGGSNTAVGSSALTSNTTASYNTAVGYQSGLDITTGFRNTLLGAFAGKDITTGDYGIGIGYSALGANGIALTGDNNIAIGGFSGTSITSGGSNTAVGYGTLQNNTTASNNTALGYQAGYTTTTGTQNTYLGHWAGRLATTAYNNTFIGKSSGDTVTTGANNTILGRYNGNQGGLDIRTSNNNIVLSDGDGNPRGYYWSDSGEASWILQSPKANQFTLQVLNTATSSPYGIQSVFVGNTPNNTTSRFFYGADTAAARFIVYSNGNVVNVNNSYGAISDVKLKENIVDAASQWDDIKALTVRKYSMKADNLDAPNMLGVIAQEVEAAGMGGLVFESPDLDPQTNEDLGTVTKQVNYSILYMKAVKALQEAMDRIETLEAKVAALESN